MSSLASLLAGREGDFDDDVDVVYTSEVHTINGFTIKMPSAEHLALRKELAQKAKKRAANQKSINMYISWVYIYNHDKYMQWIPRYSCIYSCVHLGSRALQTGPPRS